MTLYGTYAKLVKLGNLSLSREFRSILGDFSGTPGPL